MKLSDVDVREKIKTGKIIIEPTLSEQQIGSFSIDLRLGNYFRIFRPTKSPYIDLGAVDSAYTMSEQLMENIYIPNDGVFYLHSGELALGITLEKLTLPNDLVGWLDGRSSLARLGLMIHITAHTIDPGWEGNITLEFVNIGQIPLALRPKMRICAISFEPLTSPSACPYTQKANAKYIGQSEPLRSQIDREHD